MYYKSLKPLIIEESEDYIFINKPPFVSTLADRNDTVTILSLVKKYNDDYQICHRLDKETSGVLLVAKNPEAYRNASMQFEHRQVEKIYTAIVDGLHQFKDEEVNLPLHTTASGYVKISHRQGKNAKTIFNTIETFKKHTLVACRPETGRMHQIRVHLASLNASITGDETYGGQPLYLSSFKRNFVRGKEKEEHPIIKRFALHAVSISLTDLKGKVVSVEAPYPKDIEVALKQLRKNR
ncbi:RNA pseudouridine synthase [Marivirga tractuosa]|uniref:Pseudouridine synthase n=1 Tax=Marivirga tractuosa (strain ATCC 23168 / DSM 4126 / NBRC 15989 / NCIMB 1408 / VKM B-1430 / H-43) TaxID=643867 RepID=E4TLR4_MARTH|nr:RluA family pseudouridine synthase [Marivirga tractuosa]ADR23343.1 pseudouridine synthase [Marivirga tractuosa DSM 4126]BDD15983.1 RNA pseudouridine synthase [Marivirga tractuosa]